MVVLCNRSWRSVRWITAVQWMQCSCRWMRYDVSAVIRMPSWTSSKN